jgi:hypothetical protein
MSFYLEIAELYIGISDSSIGPVECTSMSVTNGSGKSIISSSVLISVSISGNYFSCIHMSNILANN